MLGTETATTRQNAEELLKETQSVKQKARNSGWWVLDSG